MKLTHVVVAGAALVSFSAIAADEAKKDPQTQSGQTQSQSAQSPQSGQSASGGATQQQGEKAGGQQMSQNKELVKQAQEKLSAAGHDVGGADGIMGPKTQKGLKEFQQSKGLQPSGQLDQKTLAELGVSGDASASTGASSDKSDKEASGSASGGASSQGSASQGSSEKSK
jgi:peptidoglycan hydrolase-like protein with peptidoglycan-binding domain